MKYKSSGILFDSNNDGLVRNNSNKSLIWVFKTEESLVGKSKLTDYLCKLASLTKQLNEHYEKIYKI